MRIFLGSFLMLFSMLHATVASAAPSNACRQCQDQQRACAANYSAKTCKGEYDICMKGCRSKS
jgi:hypothetical protein